MIDGFLVNQLADSISGCSKPIHSTMRIQRPNFVLFAENFKDFLEEYTIGGSRFEDSDVVNISQQEMLPLHHHLHVIHYTGILVPVLPCIPVLARLLPGTSTWYHNPSVINYWIYSDYMLGGT